MCWDLPTWRCVYTCVCVCLCCSEGCYYKAIIGRRIFWPLHWRAHVNTHADKHTPVLWLNLAGCIKSYLSDLCSHLMPWDRLHTVIDCVHTHKRDNVQLGGVVRANEGWRYGWREEGGGWRSSHHFTPERGLGAPQGGGRAGQSRGRTIYFIVTRRSKLTKKFCVWLPAADIPCRSNALGFWHSWEKPKPLLLLFSFLHLVSKHQAWLAVKKKRNWKMKKLADGGRDSV